jgi:hypothetical protein
VGNVLASNQNSRQVAKQQTREDLRVVRHSASSVQTNLQHVPTDPILGPIFLFSCGGVFPSASQFQDDLFARNVKGD